MEVIHSTQMYIPLKPLFSKHKGGGVQFTDVPTGNLDGDNRERVMQIFHGLVEKGYCIIIVTHDTGIAERADVVYRMSDGKLSQE